jgi:hypothetical protein
LQTIILCTSIASGLIWLVAWWSTASTGAAWFAWAAIFLTSPFFFLEFTIFPDGVGAVAATIALAVLVRMATEQAVSLPRWLAPAWRWRSCRGSTRASPYCRRRWAW